MVLRWQVSSWWLDHPLHGAFAVHVRPDGTAAALRVASGDACTVESLNGGEPYASSDEALRACERRILELDLVCLRVEPLRLVAP
jgi:hypothetical protein